MKLKQTQIINELMFKIFFFYHPVSITTISALKFFDGICDTRLRLGKGKREFSWVSNFNSRVHCCQECYLFMSLQYLRLFLVIINDSIKLCLILSQPTILKQQKFITVQSIAKNSHKFINNLQIINTLKDQQKVKMIKNTSIKIGVKIKPFTADSKTQIITKSTKEEGSTPTVFIKIGADYRKFEVDAIHDANVSQELMFKDLQIDKLVDKFVSGFNVTIMAYGQTGAGKTYCMQGNQNQTGIITDSIRMIYQKIQPDAVVSCSYIQLYNQKIFDLLVEDANIDSLKLRWQIQRDFVVEDLSTHMARSSKDLQKIWRKGTKNRIVASNKIHDISSRSHALFFVTISDRDEDNNQRFRQLTFVDLAGSERMFDQMGKLSKQTIEINKSLFALRKVIKILEEASTNKKQLYIPYRDSKLTSLLKKALGGNCLTMMIACIDSSTDQREETLLTLSYAISTGRIQNSAHVNIDQQALQNRQLKNQNQKLKKQLQTAWKQLDLFHKRQKMQAEKKSMSQYSHKIIECIGTIRQLIKSNKQLREELEQERKIKRQQKVQIDMLMEQRYMLKKFNSINDSPSPRKLQASMNFNVGESYVIGEGSPTPAPKFRTTEKEEVSPHKIIRIREVLGSTGSISPVRNLSSNGNNPSNIQNNNSTSRRPTNSVVKRKKYVFHKTEPDEILEYRPPRNQQRQQKMYEKVQKVQRQ